MPRRLLTALLALSLAGCGRLGHTRTFDVRSDSMAPSIRQGDRVACSTRVPATLRRGQVVAFRPPAATDGATIVVKRVVGVGGDRLTTKDGNRYAVNGEPVDEPYVDAPPDANPGPTTPVEVPAGEYFVMGDNRPRSSDSRQQGTIKGSDVLAVCTRITRPRDRRGPIPGT